MGIYDVGKERTVRDYELCGGFDFKSCRIHDYTLKAMEPPNPMNWEDDFLVEYSLDLEWDLEFFSSQGIESASFLTLGVHDEKGEEILRRDSPTAFKYHATPQYLLAFSMHIFILLAPTGLAEWTLTSIGGTVPRKAPSSTNLATS